MEPALDEEQMTARLTDELCGKGDATVSMDHTILMLVSPAMAARCTKAAFARSIAHGIDDIQRTATGERTGGRL